MFDGILLMRFLDCSRPLGLIPHAHVFLFAFRALNDTGAFYLNFQPAGQWLNINCFQQCIPTAGPQGLDAAQRVSETSIFR
jgi:hypothetical protein